MQGGHERLIKLQEWLTTSADHQRVLAQAIGLGRTAGWWSALVVSHSCNLMRRS
jgi:hypothetical protein